jgi:hypothetical protein
MQDRAWTPVKGAERVHPACSGKGLQHRRNVADTTNCVLTVIAV